MVADKQTYIQTTEQITYRNKQTAQKGHSLHALK